MIRIIIDFFKSVFLHVGDQGNKWNADTAYIKTYTTFQVVIEATIFNRGAYNFNNEGYIAMDDISFSKECKVDFSATLNPFPLTPTAPQGCQSGEFRFVPGFHLTPVIFHTGDDYLNTYRNVVLRVIFIVYSVTGIKRNVLSRYK